jgi:hypothetical protein
MASKSGVPAVIANEPKAVGAVYDYGSDAGAGYENTTASDYSIPYLGVLQKGSPQANEDKDTFIPGAKPGMFFNTVTQDLYDGKNTGVLFIPVHREHQIVKFVPRSAGGGFAGVLQPNDKEWLDAVERFRKVPRGGDQKKPLSADGKHELIETFNVYGLRVAETLDDYEPIVLGCAGAKRKPYKAWMTKARGVRVRQDDGRMVEPPLFAHVWRLKTVFQEGNGNDWYSINATWGMGSAVASRLTPDAPLYLSAKDFRALVISGAAKAPQPNRDDEITQDDLGSETI